MPHENCSNRHCCCTGSVSKYCSICVCTCDFQSFCWCWLLLLQIELLLCVCQSLHFTKYLVFWSGGWSLQYLPRKQTITCKLVSGSFVMTATDGQTGKRNLLCRVTYFLFFQFCHQSWRWNLLNSLYKGCFIVSENHIALTDYKENDRNRSNNIYILCSFCLLKIHFAPGNILGLLRDTRGVNGIVKKAFVTTITLLLLWTGFAQPSLAISKPRLLEAWRGFSIQSAAHVHLSPGSVDNGVLCRMAPFASLAHGSLKSWVQQEVSAQKALPDPLQWKCLPGTAQGGSVCLAVRSKVAEAKRGQAPDWARCTRSFAVEMWMCSSKVSAGFLAIRTWSEAG